MAKKPPSQHGGKRPGAGRKPIFEKGTVTRCAALPVELDRRVAAYCERTEKPLSEAIREGLELLLGR